MKIPLTPHECIQDALWNTIPELDDSMSKDQRLRTLANAVLQYLDAEGFTLIDSDAVWTFHDSLNHWLNQDSDEHRLSTFSPYDDWLTLWRRLPPRIRYNQFGEPIT